MSSHPRHLRPAPACPIYCPICQGSLALLCVCRPMIQDLLPSGPWRSRLGTVLGPQLDYTEGWNLDQKG